MAITLDGTTGITAPDVDTDSLTVAGSAPVTVADIGSYSPTLTGGGASGTWGINITGSAGSASTAVNLSTIRTNWSSNGTISAVVGQLAWKNYGNNHTIFDASNSTSPDGTAVNNTNAQIPWAGSYPTLMGWNGFNTYGVRVDSARVADSVAPPAIGDVGSYALLAFISGGAGLTQGGTYAGSNLRFAGYRAAGYASPAYGLDYGGAPAGTWRCMGAGPTNGNGSYYPASVFLRIS